jgi:NAD(P)-dependent dehydrogenase (short-subunit alcohol dehydrogenase family)
LKFVAAGPAICGLATSSGIVSDQPIRFGINATMVNAAVEGFVRAAAIEMPRGLRINVVSPDVLVESIAAYGPYFHGFEPVTAARTAKAYSRSVDGLQSGQVYKVW